MKEFSHIKNQPFTPTQKDALLAMQSGEILASYVKSHSTYTTEISIGEKKLTLPRTALHLLINALTQMAQGNTVTILSTDTELTTQEAADLLNVSRPHLVELLESGKIPHRKVGTRRRVHAQDVLAYKTSIDNQRLKTLETLSKQAQHLKMGYE